MRSQWIALTMRLAPSLARVFAMVVTFTLHIILVAILIRQTDVRPTLFQPETLDIQLQDFEIVVLPPPPPRPVSPVESLEPNIAPPPTTATLTRARNSVTQADPDSALPKTLLEATNFQSRVEHQRREVAADIARENAPKREAFAGRSIDGMLPDGETGILPGFRPKAQDGNRDTARKIMQMLGRSLPRSASDYHALLDPLTERWEDAHHSSDMADCDLKYARFDAQMRRELCGFVRPPE